MMENKMKAVEIFSNKQLFYLKIKVPQRAVLQWCIKIGKMSQCEENSNNLKNVLCIEKVSWILKVLRGTIDANKEPFMFLSIHV